MATPDQRSHPFFGPRSKIDRTRKILSEFDQEASKHINSATLEVISRVDETDLVHIILKVKEPLPEILCHLTAEAAYHLRSSLDQMVAAIARNGGMNDTSHIHYPFVGRKAEFEDRGAQRKMRGLPEDVKLLIRDTRPWSDEDGDKTFWGIGPLGNIDKHNILMPFAIPMVGLNLKGGKIDGGNHPGSIGAVFQIDDLIDGVTISRIGRAGSFRMDSVAATAVVCFGRSVEVFGMKEAAPTLKELTDLTSGVIETFATHCFGE